jgi:hypothetical protein
LDTIFIQSGLIVDADEDGDTILGYLDSGLGGDLLRVSYYPGLCQNLKILSDARESHRVVMSWISATTS